MGSPEVMYNVNLVPMLAMGPHLFRHGKELGYGVTPSRISEMLAMGPHLFRHGKSLSASI